MSNIESLSCPQCGSSDFTESSLNRFRCNHCGATSLVSDASNTLTILEWVCPKCGFDNEKGSTFCGKCGESLTKSCIKCDAVMRWDLGFCPECGFGIPPSETILYRETYSGRHHIITNNRVIFQGQLWSFHDIPLDKIQDVKVVITKMPPRVHWVELKIKEKKKPIKVYLSKEITQIFAEALLKACNLM